MPTDKTSNMPSVFPTADLRLAMVTIFPFGIIQKNVEKKQKNINININHGTAHKLILVYLISKYTKVP